MDYRRLVYTPLQDFEASGSLLTYLATRGKCQAMLRQSIKGRLQGTIYGLNVCNLLEAEEPTPPAPVLCGLLWAFAPVRVPLSRLPGGRLRASWRLCGLDLGYALHQSGYDPSVLAVTLVSLAELFPEGSYKLVPIVRSVLGRVGSGLPFVYPHV